MTNTGTATTAHVVAPVVATADLFDGVHLDETRHMIANWAPRTVLVDGDLSVDALRCECGAWVQVPTDD